MQILRSLTTPPVAHNALGFGQDGARDQALLRLRLEPILLFLPQIAALAHLLLFAQLSTGRSHVETVCCDEHQPPHEHPGVEGLDAIRHFCARQTQYNQDDYEDDDDHRPGREAGIH